MKFTIFLAIVMAVFPTIEVQGDVEVGAQNRKIWFGKKMDEFLVEINQGRARKVAYGKRLKDGILNSVNLQGLFRRRDYTNNEPLQIAGNELNEHPPLSYQVEVTLSGKLPSGNSFTRLTQYAGIYTLTKEKKNNRYVWVKQPGGHAIWSIKDEGWRIGSISEKNRNSKNTAFRSNAFGNGPTDGEHWEYRFPNNNNVYKRVDKMIRHLKYLKPEEELDFWFNDRLNLQKHVTGFQKAFKGLVDGTDIVANCIETYNQETAYKDRLTNGYNCGDQINQPQTPCGGNKQKGRPIEIRNLGWFEQQLTNGKDNGVQPIVKQWISDNTPGGEPNKTGKGYGKVSLTASGSINENAGGSLNTKDRRRPLYDLKAHFYLPGIRAQV